jgi:hypothetical protein
MEKSLYRGELTARLLFGEIHLVYPVIDVALNLLLKMNLR